MWICVHSKDAQKHWISENVCLYDLKWSDGSNSWGNPNICETIACNMHMYLRTPQVLFSHIKIFRNDYSLRTVTLLITFFIRRKGKLVSSLSQILQFSLSRIIPLRILWYATALLPKKNIKIPKMNTFSFRLLTSPETSGTCYLCLWYGGSTVCLRDNLFFGGAWFNYFE